MPANVAQRNDISPDPAPGLYTEAAAILITDAALTEDQIAEMLRFARSLRLVTAPGIAAEEKCRRRLALAAADGSDLILEAASPWTP